MAQRCSSNSSSYGINLLGQLKVLHTYGQILLGFPQPLGMTPGQLVHHVQAAAVKLYSAVPRLAGQVVFVEDSKAEMFRIAPFEQHQGLSPVRVRDMHDSLPAYEDMARSSFPIRMFPSEVSLTGLKSAPLNYIEDPGAVLPVLQISVLFITGGVLVAFSLQHTCGDATGFGLVIEHFATLLRGESLSETLIAGANFEDVLTVPRLREGQESVLDQSQKPADSLSQSRHFFASPDKPKIWFCVRFSAESLARLKNAAKLDDAGAWISTNDALTAFIWQRVTMARGPRISRGTGMTCCNRISSARKLFNPPLREGLLGCLIRPVFCPLPAKKVLDSSLAELATILRQTSRQLDDHALRSITSAMEKYPNTVPKWSPPSECDVTLQVSSVQWSHIRAHELSFGPLGRSQFARRIGSTPLAGSMYPLPKSANGDIEVQMCLWEDDLVTLKQDELWNEHAKFIG